MQVKFAIAAAVIATTLPAQVAPVSVMGNTNITISGLLAIGAKASEVTNTVRPGMATEYYLCDNTSRLIISSNSKITDGWNVIANIESRFEPNDGPGTNLVPNVSATGFTTGAYYGGWAEGDTWGGVSSPYGSITFGKNTVYYADTIETAAVGAYGPGESYRIWDANGLATFNLLDGVQEYVGGAAAGSKYTMGNTRSQNVVKYTSPMIAGAYAFTLAFSKNPYGSELQYTTTTPVSYENGGMFAAKGIYNKGPVSASISLLSVKVQGGASAYNGNTQAYRLGASYKVPVGLKVGVVFDHTAVTDAIGTSAVIATKTAVRDVFEIPISYTFLTDHAVYVTYTKAGNTSNVSNSGATQYNFVYDYAMTKRAAVGLFCSAIHNQSSAAYAPFLAGTNLGPTSPGQGENWHQIGINMNYWF
jgi:hypothetical protein